MRPRSLMIRLLLIGSAAATSVAGPTAAHAAGVAYVDEAEIWVASTAGGSKVRLSAGEGDWRHVAQSDLGYVVGVRREAGKIADVSTFTIWNPDGTVKDVGPLSGKTNGGSNVYPLGLDLTPSAGLIIYGYANYIYNFPNNSVTRGTFLLPSATRSAPTLGPVSVGSYYWSSLVGERIVGTADEVEVAAQAPGSIAGTTFTPWISASGESGAPKLHRTDVAATGTIAALEYEYYNGGGTTSDEKVLVIRAQSLGGPTIDAGQCYLPGAGKTTAPSLSQDAQSIAWSDATGVHLGGVPTFAGPDGGVCTLTRPALTIAATGSDPSFGPIDVAAIVKARTPATPAPTPAPSPANPPVGGATPMPQGDLTASTPKLTPPAKLKAATLGAKAGVQLKVTTGTGGKATATLSVEPKAVGKKGKKPVVIATGSATLKADAGQAQPVTLRATAAGRRQLRKLRGKRATITLIVGGQTATVTITLK